LLEATHSPGGLDNFELLTFMSRPRSAGLFLSRLMLD
jgi:hypothetical protein